MGNWFAQAGITAVLIVTVVFQFIVIPIGNAQVVEYCRNSGVPILQKLTDINGWNVIGIICVLLMFVAVIYPLAFWEHMTILRKRK